MSDIVQELGSLHRRLFLERVGIDYLVAELRNRIMTVHAHSDSGTYDCELGPKGRVREILDFLLIGHDAKRQNLSVEVVRREWQERYGVDPNTVDEVESKWEYLEEAVS